MSFLSNFKDVTSVYESDSKWLWLSLFLGLSLLVFSSSLGNGFALDDTVQIVENQWIRSPWRSLGFFSRGTYPGDLYRPIVMISYALTYYLVGLNPFLYHLTNVLLHGMVSFLFFLTVLSFARKRLALCAALLFVVHPLHSEVVANVSGRPELGAALFGLLSVWLVLNKTSLLGSRALLWFAIFVSALFSFMCKESAITIIGITLVMVWARDHSEYRRYRSHPPGAQSVLLCSAQWFALVPYLLLRVWALGGIVSAREPAHFMENPLVDMAAGERALNGIALLGRYIWLHVVPWPLRADYSYPVLKPLNAGSVVEWSLLGLSVSLLAILAVTIFRRPRVAASLMWFFGAFAITSNIFVPIGTIFAERLTYLPGMGLFILVSILLTHYVSTRMQKLLVAVAIVFWGGFSWMRGAAWKDDQTLFRHEYSYAVCSIKTEVIYGSHQPPPDNIRIVEDALSRYRDYPSGLWALAMLHTKQGRFDRALHLLEETIEIRPYFSPAYEWMGRIYLLQKKVDLAEEAFLALMRMDELSYPARLGMLGVFIEKGELEKAQELSTRLAEWDSSNPYLKHLQQKLKEHQKSAET